MNIQKVFITGGTGDLGSALVRELLKRPSLHVVTNGRDQSKADQLVRTLSDDEKERFHFIVADMNKESPKEIAFKANAVLGGIDMLISNVAVFQFDDIIQENESEKEKLYSTNLGGLRLADAVVDLVTQQGQHIRLCDVGSTSVIAQMLGKPFPDTMHYGKTKAEVVYHSVNLAHSNPLVSFRAIHPGSIDGKIAREIANRYSSTFVTTPEITARYAIELFLSESEEKVHQSIITSELYFAWTPQGSWYNQESEIVNSKKIEGLTLDQIVKIPVDGINSFEVKA